MTSVNLPAQGTLIKLSDQGNFWSCIISNPPSHSGWAHAVASTPQAAIDAAEQLFKKNLVKYSAPSASAVDIDLDQLGL